MDTTKKEKIDGNTNLINELSVSGKMPESGEIYINESGEVALYAVYDVSCYTKSFTDNDLIETTDTKTCKDNVLLSFNDYYNAGLQEGYNKGHDDGYNEGVADADNRENTSSTSYQSGYNKGVDDTKQGNATIADVLAGITFTSENGVNLTGTMANNGELNWKPTTSTTYTLQAGYYSGGTLDSSSVYTTGYNDGIKVTKQGTATASQVLTGYTFTNSSNVNISGTMANRGILNWSPTTSTTYTVPAGYYSGGTLDSSGAYTTGYNAGYSAGTSGGKHYWVKYIKTYGDNGYSAYGHTTGYIYHLSQEQDDDGDWGSSNWFSDAYFDLRDVASELTAAGINYSTLSSSNIYFVTTGSYYNKSGFLVSSYSSPIVKLSLSTNTQSTITLSGYLIILK
jgi:hypothetical protein